MKDCQTNDLIFWNVRTWRVIAVKLGGLGFENIVELEALDKRSTDVLAVPLDLIPPAAIFRQVHPPKLRGETAPKTELPE